MKNKSSGFISDALKLASSSIVTQFASLLMVPILTRIFKPEVFGSLAILELFITQLGGIITLGFAGAIVLTKTKKQEIKHIWFSFLVTVLISFTSLVLVYYSSQISQIIKHDYLASLFWFIPISALFWGLRDILRFLNLKYKRFYTLSISNVILSVSLNIFAIYLGYQFGGTLLNYIIASLLATFFSIIILSYKFIFSSLLSFFKGFDFKVIQNEIKTHKQFIYYNLPNSYVSRLANDIPIWILAFYFSNIFIGLYAFANRIVNIPINLISSSLAQVFYQRAADDLENNLNIMSKSSIFLFQISLPLFLLLGLYGEEIFSIVFGNEWYEAGVIAKALCFVGIARFSFNPISDLFIVLKKQNIALYKELTLTFLTLISFLIGGILNMPILGVLIFSISNAIIICIFQFYILGFAGCNMNKFRNEIFKSILYLSPVLLYLLINIRFALIYEVILVFIILTIYYYNFNKKHNLKKLFKNK